METSRVEVIWINLNEAPSVFTKVKCRLFEDGFYHLLLIDETNVHIAMSAIHTITVYKED